MTTPAYLLGSSIGALSLRPAMQQYISSSERTKEITIKFDGLSLGCVLFAWVGDSCAGEGALFVDARAGAAALRKLKTQQS